MKYPKYPPGKIVYPWTEEIMKYSDGTKSKFWSLRGIDGAAWATVDDKKYAFVWRVTNILSSGTTANREGTLEKAQQKAESLLRIHGIRIVERNVSVMW